MISSEHKAVFSSDTLNLQQQSLGSPAEPFPASKQAQRADEPTLGSHISLHLLGSFPCPRLAAQMSHCPQLCKGNTLLPGH